MPFFILLLPPNCTLLRSNEEFGMIPSVSEEFTDNETLLSALPDWMLTPLVNTVPVLKKSFTLLG